MNSKVLSLLSSSVISLSVVVTGGYSKNTTIDDESPRLFQPHTYNLPPRYDRLRELKEHALKVAKMEVQQSSGRKHVDFRNTLEIHDLGSYEFESEKDQNETSPQPLREKVKLSVFLPVAREAIKSHRVKKSPVPVLKFKVMAPTIVSSNDSQMPEAKEVSGKPTRHTRGAVITDRNQLFAQPLSPRTREYLNNLVTNEKFKNASNQKLKLWAELDEVGAQYTLAQRLYRQKKSTEALRWLDRAIQQGDKKSIALQEKILDTLHRRYAQIEALYIKQEQIKVRSELNIPCLHSRVPLFPFVGERITASEKWKKTYMQASRMLIDEPLSLEVHKLLLAVTKENPDFKDTFYRLYMIEKSRGNEKSALKHLKEAASGTQGLDVAQYQYGLELLAQGKPKVAKRWLKKASDQQYWLADKKLMELFSTEKQEIEDILKAYNRSLI
ncbi:hypothetical protein IM40_06555 [Candidatus Paracaedimonas acanthamoebae]|nr:hypothetical protein IM40_06555 [Candidatus Paracaedimonas acanthamoebae]